MLFPDGVPAPILISCVDALPVTGKGTMPMLRATTAFAALLALAACDRGASMEQTNAQQQIELNAIAANTSETAGSSGTANNGAANADAGKAYRAGARNRVRKY